MKHVRCFVFLCLVAWRGCSWFGRRAERAGYVERSDLGSDICLERCEFHFDTALERRKGSFVQPFGMLIGQKFRASREEEHDVRGLIVPVWFVPRWCSTQLRAVAIDERLLGFLQRRHRNLLASIHCLARPATQETLSCS